MRTWLTTASASSRPAGSTSRSTTAVTTSWLRPRRARSIARASLREAGLPRGRPSSTTSVSAPRTRADVSPAAWSRAATSAAFAWARLAASVGAGTPGGSGSSIPLGRTSNGTPRRSRSSRRRGEAEARIRRTAGAAPAAAGLLADDEGLGVGDDAPRVGDDLPEKDGQAQHVLVRESVVEAHRPLHALSDPLIDDGRRQGRGVVALAAHREAPWGPQARDEGLVRPHEREDGLKRPVHRGVEVQLAELRHARLQRQRAVGRQTVAEELIELPGEQEA